MTTIIFIIALVIVLVLFGRKVSTKNNRADGTEENSADCAIEDDRQDEITEQFFREVQNGKEKYEFLIISGQYDLMFVKSMGLFNNLIGSRTSLAFFRARAFARPAKM